MTPAELEIGRQIEQTRFLIGEAQEKLGAGVDPQTFIRQQNEELVKQSARGGEMSHAEQDQAKIDADRYEAAEKIINLQKRLEDQQAQMAAAGPAVGGPGGPGRPGGSGGPSGPGSPGGSGGPGSPGGSGGPSGPGSPGGPSAGGDSGGSKSVRERMRDALQKFGSEQKLSAVDAGIKEQYKTNKKELDDLLKKESKALSSALSGDVGSLDDLKAETPAEKQARAEKIQELKKGLAEMKEKDPGLAQLDRNTVGRNVHSAARDLANKVGQKLK